MEKIVNYGFGKSVAFSFEKAIERVSAELQKEGFGILTEIDVAATLKKKLDLDMSPYLILGACNPSLAHRALEIDPSIGLLLPCNVVVRQVNQDEVYIEIMDPIAILDLVKSPRIGVIAEEAKTRLERVLKAI